MQRPGNNGYPPQGTIQQQQEYSQMQQYSEQQQQGQHRITRSEQHVQSVQRSHITTQQRVQQTGMIQQQTIPQLTQHQHHIYGRSDISPPIFEKIFKNARFAQGGNALFEGKLNGNPKPVVSWTRKGVPMVETNKFRMSYNEVTGEVSLLINQIGPGDEGEYTCTARNQYGEAICSVYIQPEGTAMPTIQPVHHQNVDRNYSNGYTYTSIEEEFRVDTFEYRLLREVSFRESITHRSSHESDYYLSQEVDRNLGPAHAPQIAQKPRNSKLVEGSDAVFSARVGSNPKPRLTWFKNGQRLQSSNKHEISYSNQTASLRIRNANVQDAGHYTLLAENTQGCVVSSAVLAVEPAAEYPSQEPRPVDYMAEQAEAGKALPPTFTKVFNNQDTTEGKMVRFDCRINGKPYPEVFWFINGRQIRDDANHKILVNESGSHSLLITNVTRLDCGVVQCIARNKAGEVGIEANLNVTEKEQIVAPTFVQRFTTCHVREGEPIALSARAIGTPVPRITWQKDGGHINSTNDRYIGIDGGATCLEIPRCKATDAGWYECTAQNIAGSTVTRARLHVDIPQPPPQEQRRLNLPRPTKIIEPAPEIGPEIIYLRHVERAKPVLRPGEEDRVYPPPQFIVPLQNVQQEEGGRVHFEARIEPVGDPTMVVEWFFNGRPMEASSRATSVFKFGFLALDLISIMAHDSGEYLCRVSNMSGVAESRAILTITQRPGIEKFSQHPESMQQIQQLEDYSRYQRQESSEEIFNQKPNFIRPLRDLGSFEEGKNVHFEAQLTPVNDPSMRVEWYKDGRPITASSRITAIFNFGYVSLNIMHLRAEDAGSYTVRAVNKMGEAISTSNIQVVSKSQVTGDLGIPEQQRYIEKVEQLEHYQKAQHQKYTQEIPESRQAPEFKTQIQNQIDLREGGYAHFEARLEPIGDSTLRVEWLKDGQILEASSRITPFFNFGYVALTVKQLTIYDIGVYTCRAYNACGEAHTSANLTVVKERKDIVTDSQIQGGYEKIQRLEDSSRYQRREVEETTIQQAPRFLGPLKGTTKIVEGQRAHFEARVEPQSDLSLKIEWYHNGQPIMPANRIQTYHDFGYVALDVSAIRAEDAGVYTVVARNKLGEAQLQATMVVETRSSIDTSSMHRGLYEKTKQMEGSKHVEPQYDIEEISKSKPIFVQPLSDPKPIHEGKNIHLECRLEPMGDPSMRVEWFHNGRPITVGSRFRTYNDFGFVALDIVKTVAMDSGEYTCRATNHLGSAHTSACVRVIDRSDVVTETQNEMSLEQIQMLEESTRKRHHVQEDITVMHAPQFTRPLHNIETIEGTNVHLECRLQPVGDPTMVVEWFVNGHPVKTGHRFRPAYEFDYVALDLLGCYAADSGVYTCQARNQLGESVTSCSVRIIAKKDLILDTQNASGLEKIQYLEDSSRYKRSEYVDEIVNVRPRFITQPKSLSNLREGTHAHFECKIEPVTDPNLKVEWFKNGHPITVGHRFRPIHDFGYVALDIVDLIAEDSGTYTCRAINMIGSAETHCTLQCRSSEQIVTLTQNEHGLEQIHYLEDRTKKRRTHIDDEVSTQSPVFTTSLKNVEIKENQRAHFECRLIPVSDPTLKVEWYHNNAPLKSGSRFTETNNFGFVALDIMGCLPEDAGTYTCRAVNACGEAVTSAIAVIHTKQSIYRETQHEGALHRLSHLEDSSKYKRTSIIEEVVTQPPVFTMPVRDVRVAENQAVHFEARLIPVGDPKLSVEWLRNGVPIEASNRISTMHDFGYVALNMKYVNPEDSGTYTCRAMNELGQAVTSATLIVQTKASLQMETQNEMALQKIHQLEDHTKYQRTEEDEYEITQPPRFVARLNGPASRHEGQSAHYECRIEPYPDPNMQVEWFHNGKPLQTGHRFRTTYDFGFAALNILTVYAEDSGEYTCKVTNRLGTASSSIKLQVQSKSSIIYESQHDGALQKIQYLEDESRFQRKTEEEQFVAERPQFGRPLRNVDVPEGRPVHLEATLTPVNDPTMQVEWFCNGKPILTGHRFKTTYDFGFVALDILYAHAEDSGTYMCKAKNAVGEAVTTSAVNVTANARIYHETLDAQRLEKIRQLESYEAPKKIEVEDKGQKPVFLTPLTSLEHLKEGEHAHLECRVEPINDPKLKIEWFFNGKAIMAGHRFRTTHDFGYVALDVLYVYGEDSGTYMCKATNLLGEAVNTCSIRVLNRRSMILDSQHPDALEKIQKLESRVVSTRSEVEDLPISPPSFSVQLRGTTEIYEGESAHFEAQVQPVHDPNLRIEFYRNGKPLPSASRYHITFDFGYIALDIQKAVAEDSGEYSVKAFNALGQCVSSTNLRVLTRGTIIADTQHPEGLEKIRQLESTSPFKRPEIDTPGTRQRPVFTQPLQNIDRIQEQQTAHFECRLIPVGDPNLKVEWYRNEKLIEDSSRITKQHDFGFVSLDISAIRKEDEGVYMCRAVNPLGEAVTTASMRVVTEASIQMDTQHPESIGKIHQLERPSQPRQDEPERIFEKPIFTQLLTGPSELWEGQHAHFEARVVPVGDPSLKFEWYINGVELKFGSRLRTTNDFGFVTLDISSVVQEDSGVYMCRAFNAAGEAVSSTAMKVKTKSSIVGEPLIPESWEAVRLKEAAMNRVPVPFVDSTPQQAPVFTTHLTSHDKLTEGQNIRLEAQVEPRADANLRIEWFKNGVPLTTGARIHSTFDFGLVTLLINGLRADDSAIYTCKATNLVGEAVSTCTLKIEGHHWLMGDTMHPASLPRINALEAPREGRQDAPEPVYESPVFISHLNNIECTEGDNVRFECNVEPSRDPTMQIEWFVNGKPLQAAAKYKSMYDFGYCSLDLVHTYAEDSGIFTCKATNSKGSATTSGILKCKSTKTMYLETQHPQGEAGLESIEQTEAVAASRYQRQESKPETQYPAPVWTVPIQPEFQLSEGQTLHLEGNFEPKEDPNLKIEWYFNGKVLQHGSRFKMTNEFGFVTLDLVDIFERDQGIYTCKAYNKAGEAFTTSTVFCIGHDTIIEKTQHPKGAEGLEEIQNLEESLRKDGSKPEDQETGQAPKFTTDFVPIPEIAEGDIAHFDANLIPTGDQTMVIEWFYNGEVLKASHRIRTIYAFGMVALEVIGTKIEDSGTYTCRATNKYGSVEQSVTLGCVDRISGQKPRFTSHIQNLSGLKDGQSAHFECTLVPVNDPDMKVEWFHNGKPLRHSNRIKPVADFGYVLLDIAYVQSHDSGEYVCRASNKYGEDTTRATLQCTGKGGVFYDSLQPESLDRIRELECPQGQQPRDVGGISAEPPKFTQHIKDVTQISEGQSAHFEARLTPVNDPDLVVEWYFNGKKLPSGHRYRTFHDFGIVILDILYCYEENSGIYECRAYNKYGEDVTKATLKCSSKSSLVLDSQLPRGMEGGLEKIQNLEDSMIRTTDESIEEKRGKAPVFIQPLSNIENMREGENAHFEAKLTPIDDPKLKVEWYWNGKPLRAGSRFRTFCDFGFVILEISPVYPEDSGEFSCRAINDYGEAVTTATMKIQGKRSIILESQLPKGMEGTIGRIAELEGLGVPGNTEFLPEDDSGKPPEFITTPFDLVINENSLAHFECRLTPVNDPSLRVDWFHNGKALWAGSRIKTIHDFGFVILEIAGCYQRDGGLYTCKATNKHGEATVSCKLQVKGRQGIVMEPQLPSNFRTGTESLQRLEEHLHKREEIFADEEKPNPPKFIEEIKDNLDVNEGGPIHFDCRVEPVSDPSMRIDWYHNGRPMPTGSRVHMLNDFGYIALDIDYIYARDSGEYVCKATNKWGSATTTAKVSCKSKHGIISESQLPDGMTAAKLKDLERGQVPLAPVPEDTNFGPPQFLKEISSITVEEAEAVRFETQVEPKQDPKLRVEWYRNGKLLPSGHRYRNIFDMGYVSLDILYVYGEDSGEYVCRAVNDFGEAITKATISCRKLPSIILQNQVPRGMKRQETLTQMEATIKKYTSEVHLTEEDLFDAEKKQPPRFVTQIKDHTNLTEMEETKFECQLAPVGDPNMKVEWFFNGKPLHHKNRFMPIYDFGYVAMNFGWVYPEDSGEYVCRATNLYGSDETRAVIKTTGKPGIIYDSQLPKGMKSIEKIRAMEASWQVAPEEFNPDDKPRTLPIFVSKLEPQTVEEGEPARFCIRVTGHPRPRVMWLINGHTVVHGSRYKLTNDGMYHLDIPKTRQYDTGKIEVIARNSLGEAVTSTELKIVPRSDDYRGVLKNSPRPWYDYDLVSYQQERIDNTELEKVFDERKQYLAEQSGTQLKGVEQLKTSKVIKAEQPEWQQTVKAKKTDDYYSKLSELEQEQLLKETKLREDHHQKVVPGQKPLNTTSRSMAQTYEQNITQEQQHTATIQKQQRQEYQQTQDTTQIVKQQQQIQQQPQPQQPHESSVHGREVHMSKQKQTQKEVVGDLEITRKITATETTEVEHKGHVQERVVQGPVKPAKAPFFTKKIAPCRVFENDQAKFEVEFDGEPNPAIKWYRENFQISNSKDFQIHTFSNKSILMIRQCFVDDSAVFSCIAENRGGTAKCSANLVVEERRRSGKGGITPPSFVQTLQNTTVSMGQLARFDAKVTGSRPLQVYWLRNNKKIQPTIKYKILEEDNTHTLLIIEPTQDDAGRYECVVCNDAGEARCDAECFIETSGKAPGAPPTPSTPGSEKAPTIIEPLKNQSIEEGHPVTFKCRAVGKPTPVAQWYKGENLIKQSRYFQMSREGEHYSLRISEAFPEDEGTYKCVVSNQIGKAETKSVLKVKAPEAQDGPPKITALKDVNVSEGMPAQFKTTMIGKVQPTNVQWYREGALIPETPDFQMVFDGNSAVLLIGTTYEEDSGIFTVRVTSNSGQVESSAKLTVKKRRTSAYQLHTIDSVEDEYSSSGGSGKEDSSPESPQPQQGQQYNQFLSVNSHQSRSRTKSTKKRSKSLQPQGNICPWRKSSRPARGRSLEKAPFLPGFKPQETKSWAEETISLKPAEIQKKEIPKYELAKVFLKTVKAERNQGLLSMGYQLEKIISGKSEKEALPWITMREKLKAVEKTQSQIEKFELKNIDLKPIAQHPQEMVKLEPVHRAEDTETLEELERLKKYEDAQITEITQQMETLLATHQVTQKADVVPWKEMKENLKKVQTVQKQIQKFKVEDVELKSVKDEFVTQETFTTVEDTIVYKVDQAKLKELRQIVEQSNLQTEQFVTVEDSNILSVQEFERLEAQKLIQQQQAVNWRKARKDRQMQHLAHVEDSNILHVQETIQQESALQRTETEEMPVYWRKQKTDVQQEQVQYQDTRQVEDSNILKVQQYEKQTLEQKQQLQKIQHIEDSTILSREEFERAQQKVLYERQEEPVNWRRGKKQTVESVEDTSLLTVERSEIEQIEEKKPDEVPVMWERGKKKPKQTKAVLETTEDSAIMHVEETLQEEVKQPEPEQPVLWERGKRKQIVEEVPEEIKPETGIPKEPARKVRPVPKQEEKVEQVMLKPTPRRPSKPIEKEGLPESVQLKPVRKQQVPTASEHVEEVDLKPVPKQAEISEDVVDEVQFVEEEPTKPKPKTKTKKDKIKPSKSVSVEEVEEVEKEVPEIPKQIEESVEKQIPKPTPEEVTVEEAKVPWKSGQKKIPLEQEQAEAKQWPKGKRLPLQEEEKEEVSLKPIPRKLQKEEEKIEKPLKTKKKVQEPLPEIGDFTPVELEKVEHIQLEKEVIKEEPTPVPWQRGIKPKPEEEIPEEKSWPKGKRRPLETEEPEKVTLKPIPRKPKEVAEEVIKEPTIKPTKIEEVPQIPEIDDSIKFKPTPIQEKEVPSPKEKTKKKKKPKVHKETPGVEEISQESFEELPSEEHPVAEEAAVLTEEEHIKDEEVFEEYSVVEKVSKKKKKPKKAKTSTDEVPSEEVEELPEDFIDVETIDSEPVEEIKDIAITEEVMEHSAEEILPVEETPKEKATKKRTKKLKQVSFDDHPETVEARPYEYLSEEEVVEEEKQAEVSQKSIVFKKQEEVKPRVITKEQIIEVDTDYKQEIEMKTGSNIIKKERKHLIMDDSQPLPELELITQRRVQEGVDKVPEEEVIEDSVIQETTDQTISEIADLEEQLVKVTEKKEIKPPKFVKKLKPKKVTPKTTTVLECKVEGVPTPEIKWFFNDVELFATEQYEITVSETVTKLYIKNVTPKEVGLYTCEARNEAGVATTRANIVLAFEYIPDSEITGQTVSVSEEDLLDKTLSLDESPPKIIKKLPEVVQPKEGELAKLEVKVTGKPQPKVKWMRDGEEIHASEEYQIENFEDGTSILVINHVYPDDYGTISFEAHNPLGVAVTTAEFAVEGIVGTKDYRKPEWVTHMEEMQKALKAIKCTPVFLNEMRDCRAAEGRSTKFECQFRGNPIPDVQWFFGTVQIKDSEKYRIVVEEEYSSCEVKNITLDDEGFFICKITNEIGQNVTRAKFQISTSAEEEVKREKKTSESSTASSVVVTKPKKKPIKKAKKDIHKTTVSVVPRSVPVEIIEKSEVSEIQIVRDRKEADAIQESKLEIQVQPKPEPLITTTTTTTTTQYIEVVETVRVIKEKISKKTLVKEDVEIIRNHEVVEKTLKKISAKTFGETGEESVRDLASIGLMINYGVTVQEVVYMYENNIFFSLKQPEAQAALVSLVEREGHEALITQVIAETAADDEKVMASTVGFNAFIKMIETCDVSVEETILKFAREDFITQDWKISKERVIETAQTFESHAAVTHVKVEETYIEERTIVASEGLPPDI